MLQTLLRSVYKIFTDEVEATQSLLIPYLSLNNPPFSPDGIPARKRFLTRRIKLVQNLVRWRKYTKDRFNIGELATRLLIRCFVPVAESGWDVGGQECVRKASIGDLLSPLILTRSDRSWLKYLPNLSRHR